MSNDPQTTWLCDFLAPSGYGRASRSDLRSLVKMGYAPHVEEHRHDMTQVDLKHDPFWGSRWKKVLEPADEHPAVVVWQETPEFYRPDPTSACVARIEWETSRIVDYDHASDPTHNWVTQLNAMTEVWAASAFTMGVLKDSGVTTPCVVIPHPVDLDLFKPGPKTPIGGSAHPANRDRFTVLSIFQWTTRKNPDALLTAWSRSSLGKRDDCCLFLKTYAADFTTGRNIISNIARYRALLNIRGLKQNVYPITWLVSEHEMADLYRGSDAFITASRGEGYGLPVDEAMACGIPCIYSDNTSQGEFAVGYPVRCTREPVTGMPHIPWYSAEQDWWSADVLHMVERIEEAYSDWKTGKIREYGQAARARVEDLHSDARCGAMLLERIRDLGARFA